MIILIKFFFTLLLINSDKIARDSMIIDAVRLNDHQSFNEPLAVENGSLFLYLIYIF